MYTGTIFNWHDNSGFEVGTDVVDTTNRPLFMVVNSFDKGPEKLMEVDANSFNTLFGNMSYERHGQASIQAQKIINAGGRLLVKRVCADNSGLANSVLVATVKDGVLTWEIKCVPDPEGNSTAPKTFNDVKKYALANYYEDSENGKSYPLFVITDIGRGESIKAVRIIPDYDTARGLEKMIYKFNIYEGTTLIESSNISFDPTYQFNDEYYGLDKNRMTQVTGEVIPEIFEEYLYDITKLVYPRDPEVEPEGPSGDTAYEARIQEMMNIVSGYDLINAQTYKGEEIDQIDINGNVITHENQETHKIEPTKAISVGDESIDFNTIYGNKFGYVGSYGIYGKSPAKLMNDYNVNDFFNGIFSGDNDIILKELPPSGSNVNEDDYKAYRNLVIDIARVYYGVDTDGKTSIDEVWDTDAHKIFAIMDANYHKFIKDAIANFVEFRKDCLFLRDSGIGYYSVKDAAKVYKDYTLNNDYIKAFDNTYTTILGVEKGICSISSLRSNFIADYGTTFEVVDPGTKKNIEVTMLYDMAEKLTQLYIDQGPFAPLAGTYNGFELDSAIEGTVNFIPIITPTSNQKQAIDDLRLNYAIFEDEDTCVIQSNYTSQDKNTQLSFINNVLAIQEVARVVRTVCPRNRFRLITGSDMSEYANAVSRVLQGYNTYFETLEFVYTEDPLRSIQKIFYASINFSFNNWAQTEIFDLYALANTTTTSNNS